jgi:hypothetical protein
MFYAIDKITGKIVLSINMRYENYKSTYNKSLRFICGGCINNGEKCNDNNVSFVNSKVKQPHFRHSKNTDCSASKDFKEFNIDFYKNWFELFKKEYRKPYWFNVNLEQIRYDNNIIMIRYSHQTENIIRKIEKYVKEDNKIKWILSFENRKGNIKVFQGKIYIDFVGKNDIPIYNSNKSHIYLDTGYDVLLKVKLDSYNSKGQEIEIVYIKDFCKEYDELFISYPYRKKWILTEFIINKIKDDNDAIIKEEYYKEINVINDYDYICYNYLISIFMYKEGEKERLRKEKDQWIKYKEMLEERLRKDKDQLIKDKERLQEQLRKEEEQLINDKNKLEERLRKEEKLRKNKIKEQLMKIKIKNDNDIIQQKYNYYIDEYKITDDELLNVLLNIIKNNNEKIKNVKDGYLHKYFIYITHHLNYDIFKMIKYIIYQEMYL